jgi:hypothetical protein
MNRSMNRSSVRGGTAPLGGKLFICTGTSDDIVALESINLQRKDSGILFSGEGVPARKVGLSGLVDVTVFRILVVLVRERDCCVCQMGHLA